MLCIAAVLVLASAANASQLLVRDAVSPALAVDAQGRALVTYRTQAGELKRVLAWGAVDALPPTPGVPQVAFQVDFTGGWGAFKKAIWKTFKNVCGPYAGPAVPWFVGGCTAPDGSHWVLQSWQRSLRAQGKPSTPLQSAWELRLSHFTGELAQLEVWQDWKYDTKINAVFGRMTYRGSPVYGFGFTPRGEPTDGYGRLVYYDTLDSGYGPGWRRADAMSTHAPGGVFCAIFARNLTDKFGTNKGFGSRYRITVSGPGVTPDVSWEDASLPLYDPKNAVLVAHEREMNRVVQALADPDPRCAAL